VNNKRLWTSYAGHGPMLVVDASCLYVVVAAAQQAVEDLRLWPGERFDQRFLLDRAWELRGSMRSWDALYVTLAEALDATLLTRDARLARAPGRRCHIQVI